MFCVIVYVFCTVPWEESGVFFCVMLYVFCAIPGEESYVCVCVFFFFCVCVCVCDSVCVLYSTVGRELCAFV